ncbi:hypothetical protein EZV62_001125 [Acer yangbiense]|uniref:CCHC-type domain-containing protein n=1 Tax=Acer yangbiense TaxID=1000413 RepID=A0A5C7IVI8_9ROSI|nr:hypothetical protein EZV62_001125 [Acer yangbiense]
MSADMATGSSVALHVPQFSGENYQIWVVKMKSYLKSFGLWEYVAEDKQVLALRANPTIAQIKQHEEEKMKRDKAVTCLHSALTDSVFTSIMHLETSKEIWDELKERYEGSERVRNVKMLTLKREFEMLKMKESESVKDYSSKLSELVNQMRLYGETTEDYKVVEKMLISLPEKFEAKVAAIEESCDLKKMTISEMMKESESVKDYSSKLSVLVNQMRLYGETAEDYKVVEKMLISLPEKFEAKVAAIEESCDLKKMTISEMMKESESVKDYSSKLSELVNQMRLYGETAEDYKVVEKMLISLPEKFEAKVAAIEESSDLKKMTISEMVSKLQAQEQRVSMRSNNVTEGAFQARHKGKQPVKRDQQKQNFDRKNGDQKGKRKIDGGSSEIAGKSKFPPCLTCKRTNHLSKDCWYKGKQQIQCNLCKKWGHKEKFCRSKPQPAQQANFTDEYSEAEDHITNVKLGNGVMVQATGKGTVSVHTGNGPKLIHDVLLIPDLDQNLLSVAQLLKKGYAANSKGYRVFNLQAKKLIISRDIQVDEDAYWDWENE